MSRPGVGSVVDRIGVENPLFRGPNALQVVDAVHVDGRSYLQVLLARRPNGSSGWVDATTVSTTTTPWRVVVELSRRRVLLLRSGVVVARTRAVVGRPDTPTPVGRFAVSAHVRLPASSPLGRHAVALTAFSTTQRRLDGGLPIVAFHAFEHLGARLGTAASHGCVRVPTGFVRRLAVVPRGAPVWIES
jgi:lipoprotein-anchoring transpeptidase ErfK/SrfK